MDGDGMKRRYGSSGAAISALLFLCLTAFGASLAQGARAKPAYDGARIEDPAVVPNFALHDQDGRRVSMQAERGKLVLLTFLYTECKDVCPLTAGNLNQAVRRLGADGKNVRVLAVSVDPVGDTPKAVRKFVREHRLLPQFRYLMGTARQLQPVWSAYNVKSIRRKAGDIDHTLYTLLIDRHGKARVIYDAGALPFEIAHDLRLVSALR
jgi:protein SCO1/2